MISDALTRITLWLSTPFNLIAAYAIYWPENFPGTLFALPVGGPAIYSGMLAVIIAGFGLAYGWAAMQKPINTTVVGLGMLGKYAVFVVAGLLLLTGDAPAGPFIVTLADAAFATIWLLWLLGKRT